MSAGAQAHAFYREVARTGDVWSLGDGQSMFVVFSESGARVFPHWSLRRRAQRIVDTVPGVASCKVLGSSSSNFLDNWAAILERDGILVGINWAGSNANGFEMPVKMLASQIEAARDSDA
jgi:uncharacterized protein DUF2750